MGRLIKPICSQARGLDAPWPARIMRTSVQVDTDHRIFVMSLGANVKPRRASLLGDLWQF